MRYPVNKIKERKSDFSLLKEKIEHKSIFENDASATI
jgi:hypothetical protein